MEVTLEEAVAYLSGFYMVMNIKNKKIEENGEHVGDDEKLLTACLEAVLADVKINQFKTKEE